MKILFYNLVYFPLHDKSDKLYFSCTEREKNIRRGEKGGIAQSERNNMFKPYKLKICCFKPHMFFLTCLFPLKGFFNELRFSQP